MIVVFDLDGTLCDNSAREHLAIAASKAEPWEKDEAWDKFHAGIPEDPPIWPVLNMLHSLQYDTHSIHIWTARPERFRHTTREWLDRYGIWTPRERIKMRTDGDHRPAPVVKLGWYKEAAETPSLVFEDHPGTVRLLRSAGCVVAQVGDRMEDKK